MGFYGSSSIIFLAKVTFLLFFDTEKGVSIRCAYGVPLVTLMGLTPCYLQSQVVSAYHSFRPVAPFFFFFFLAKAPLMMLFF